MAAAAAVPSARKMLRADHANALVKIAQRVQSAKTKEDAVEHATRLLERTTAFLDRHGRRVCYMTKGFGSKGRYGWCAWWYSNKTTKETEDWLRTVDGVDDTPFGMCWCTERRFHQKDWDETDVARSGSIVPYFVTTLAPLTEEFKAQFTEKWTRKLSFGDDDELAASLEAPVPTPSGVKRKHDDGAVAASEPAAKKSKQS